MGEKIKTQIKFKTKFLKTNFLKRNRKLGFFLKTLKMSYKVVDTRELLRKLEQEAEESRKERFKLEEKIFSFESTYLENTIPYGNCVLGWTEDGFEKAEQDTKENKVRKTSVEKIDQA